MISGLGLVMLFAFSFRLVLELMVCLSFDEVWVDYWLCVLKYY